MVRVTRSIPADRVFKETIIEHQLVKEGDKVLVGLSGGADSVCLLDLFITYAKELKVTVAACHVNHGLRGGESKRDERFTASLCAHRNVEYITRKADVKGLAKKKGLSLETAARECRYAAFADAAEECGADVIATAHHREDLAETLLYRLFKGTGLSGLTSIPVRRGNIIRPLLYVSRKDILERIEKRKLKFVRDRSNEDESFDRNYIRRKVVPAIEERFPGFVAKAAELSRLAADEERYWDEQLATLDRYRKETDGGFTLDKKIFGDGVPDVLVRRKVRQLLRETGGKAYVGSDLIARVISFGKDSRGNKTVFRAGGIRILSSYNNLCFLKEPKKFHKRLKHVKLKEPINVSFGNASLAFSRVDSYQKASGPYSMVFDPGKVNSVTVRGRKNGDRFKIGGGKTKKVQDFLVDAKVDRQSREGTVVIADPAGRLIALWVPGRGFRVSEEFYVREGSTGPYCEVKVNDSERA